MKIKELLSDKNLELYNEICKSYKVVLKKGNEDSWTSRIDEDRKEAIIEWCNCKFPEESFVHELLHFKCQIMGFKRMRYGCCSADKDGYFSKLITALDNELQHHKIYSQYMDLGYDEHHFYNDNDSDTAQYILDYLNNPQKKKLTLLTNYLTVISPGSELIFNNLNEIKSSFRNLCTTRYKDVIDCIDVEIKKWVNSTSYDAKQHISKIFQMIPGAEYTFIGYGDLSEGLSNGFFTNVKFTFEEFDLKYGTDN